INARESFPKCSLDEVCNREVLLIRTFNVKQRCADPNGVAGCQVARAPPRFYYCYHYYYRTFVGIDVQARVLHRTAQLSGRDSATRFRGGRGPADNGFGRWPGFDARGEAVHGTDGLVVGVGGWHEALDRG